MKTTFVMAVLVAVVAVATALPQGQGRAVAQGEGNGKRKQDLQVTVGGKRKKITDLTEKDVEEFFATPDAVDSLVTCFERPRRCRNRTLSQLVRVIRNSSKDTYCRDCTKEENDRLKNLINKAISTTQQQFPKQWRKLVPHLERVLS